jgi:hypothetical protein
VALDLASLLLLSSSSSSTFKVILSLVWRLLDVCLLPLASVLQAREQPATSPGNRVGQSSSQVRRRCAVLCCVEVEVEAVAWLL